MSNSKGTSGHGVKAPSGLNISQRKCLVKHARDLFTKMVQVGPGLTDQNVKGVKATAETAIQLAELFQTTLEEAGHGNPDE